LERIIRVFIIFYGEIRCDVRVLWITSTFPERIMLANQGTTAIRIPDDGQYGNPVILSVVIPHRQNPLDSPSLVCGLVLLVVPGYRPRGPGSIPGATRFFRITVGLERGPLSLVSTIEELLRRKSSGSGLENLDYGRTGSAALTTRHPSIRKCWHYLRRQSAVALPV
jgi:hypothetical protein